MKKIKYISLICAGVVALTACGSSDVKVIEKESTTGEVTETADINNVESAQQSETETEDSASQNAYYYTAEGPSGSMDVTPDMDMSQVLDTLGKEVTYFEAASCAFEGLDKVYTYDHFEIDTYPEGNVDKISTIILLDDLTTTKEGVYVGQSKADMESAYGTDYENNGNSYIYTKGDMRLEFVLEGETIISISYNSKVLDDAG
ncbi:MAG: hypothetical protein IJV29_06655 [Butyrivibrio sp.]|nr:hypothetical protein [Butyrivibrio sp.]